MHLNQSIACWLGLLLITSCSHKPGQGTVFGYRYNPNQPYIQANSATKPPIKSSHRRTSAERESDVEVYVSDEVATRNRTLGENNEPQVVVLSVAEDTPPEAVAAEKPGFVRSPHAPQAGLIDIRGYPPGTEVQDPYSGKPFLVPIVD